MRSSSSRKRTRVTATSLALAAGVADSHAAHHLVLAPGQRSQEALGLGSVARLAEGPAVEHDRGVDPEHALALDRTRLAQRVLQHQLARLALAQLLDLRHLDAELDAELLEDRPPAG